MLPVLPVPFVAGMLGTPIAGNAIARTFIQPKENLQSQAEADAELRRLMRNFAIFNAIAAGGLGYLAAKGKLSEGARSAVLGGAIGTGLLAAMMTGALVTGPEVVKAPAQLPIGTPLPRNFVSAFVVPAGR